MARKKNPDKAHDDASADAFRRLGSDIQVDVWDIGKVLDAGREASKAGQNVDEAVKQAFAKFRKN